MTDNSTGKLTGEQKAALRNWQFGGSGLARVQEMLRDGRTEQTVLGGGGRRETITDPEHLQPGSRLLYRELPGIFSANKTREPVTLWRGASIPGLGEGRADSLVGQVISDKGAIATGVNKHSTVGLAFGQFNKTAEHRQLLEIRTPAGTHYATPEQVNQTGFGEVILKPGTRFKVISAKDTSVTSSYGFNPQQSMKHAVPVEPKTYKVRHIVVEVIPDGQ